MKINYFTYRNIIRFFAFTPAQGTIVYRQALFIVMIFSGVFAQSDADAGIAAAPDSVSPPSSPGDSLRRDRTTDDSSADIETMPRVIHSVTASYPDSLQETGIAGPVVFDLLISEKGTVDSLAIVKGLCPVLDSSALHAVRLFIFSPAIAGARPTAVVLRYAYRFSPGNAINRTNKPAGSSETDETGSQKQALSTAAETAQGAQPYRSPIGPGELKRVPGFDGEGIKSVQALPGVSRPMSGGGEIIIRGSDLSDSKFCIDGIELPYLSHAIGSQRIAERGFIDRGILNTDALERVSLYPGGWGVGFGNALGGIVDAETRPARTDRWHGSLTIELLKDAGLLFETPLWKNAGIIGSFRGNFLFDGIGFLNRHVRGKTDAMTEDVWDHFLRFDWQITPSQHITLTTVGAIDTTYTFSTQWEQERKFDPSHELYSFGKTMSMGIATWSWAVSPTMKNYFTYALCPMSLTTRNNSSVDYMYYSTFKTTQHDAHDALTYTVHDGLSFTAGLTLRLEPFTSTDKKYSLDTVIEKSVKTTFGRMAGFILCEWKPTDRLTLSPGLRYDYYSHLTYHGSWLPEFWNYGGRTINNRTRFSGDPSLRISAAYTLDDKQSLIASIGNYCQSPDAVIMTEGTKNGLASEKSSQYTLGYKRRLDDLLTLSCNGYFGMQWDKHRGKTAQELQENSSSSIAANGKGRVKGLEFMLRHDQSRHFSGWLCYSLSQSQLFDYAQGKWVESDHNTLNNLQLVTNWLFKKTHSIGFRFQYTDGFPFTPPVIQWYDATNFYYLAGSGPENSKHRTPYWGLDLRYEKKIIFKHSRFTIAFELQRLIHFLQYVKDKNDNPVYSSSDYDIYNNDYSASASYPLFPLATLGVTWEF